MDESHENVRREKKEAVASAFGRSGLSIPSGSSSRRLPVAPDPAPPIRAA